MSAGHERLFKSPRHLLRFASNLALPDHHDFPVGLPQRSHILAVALDRTRKLLLPEDRIGLWVCGLQAVLMTMPETAVHEDRGAAGSDNDIRLSCQSGYIQAISESFGAEQGPHDLFRDSILAPNTRHIETALLGGVNVCH